LIQAKKTFICFLMFVSLGHFGLAQNDILETAFSISFEEVELDEALNQISLSSGALFSYNSGITRPDQRFSITLENSPLRNVLTRLFIGTGILFKEVNGQIVLIRETTFFLPPKKYELTGIISDRYTNEPVAGVNVFIAGTLKGSSTNLDGVYLIKDVNKGLYELAASHISYEITIAKVDIRGTAKKISRDFALNPKINQLKELKVVSLKYKEWEKYFGIFKQEFLGSTHNARRCEILNPEVLDFIFYEEEKSIIVKAYKPLIIINTALGYELDYYLKFFEIVQGNTRSTGISNFKELEPKNEREKKKWAKNRLKSYHGSITHFLRSLANSSSESKGFKIFGLKELPLEKDIKSKKINPNALVENSSVIGEKVLKFDNYLKVVYTKETETSAYVDDQIRRSMGIDPYVKDYYNSVRRGVSLGKQTSFIKLNYKKATLNAKGFFKESLAATTFGYWSWERLAESLPSEYEP
jgi:hypothetical protein